MSNLAKRLFGLFPFLLLFPPVISLIAVLFAVELCGIPGLIHTKYLEWFRIPVFDAALFAWLPFRVPGFVGDGITIYLLLGSLNAKAVNYTESEKAPGHPVGIRRIAIQIGRGDFRNALIQLKHDAKLFVLWPRTIVLFWKYYNSSPPAKDAMLENYFGILVNKIAWTASWALIVIPLVSGAIVFLNNLLCGALGPA